MMTPDPDSTQLLYLGDPLEGLTAPTLPTTLAIADDTVVPLALPATSEVLATLPVGQALRLFGTVFTLSASGQQRCASHLEQYGELPFDLSGEALLYAETAPSACSDGNVNIIPTPMLNVLNMSRSGMLPPDCSMLNIGSTFTFSRRMTALVLSFNIRGTFS